MRLDIMYKELTPEKAMQCYKEMYYRKQFEKALTEKVNRESEVEWANGFNFTVTPMPKEGA